MRIDMQSKSMLNLQNFTMRQRKVSYCFVDVRKGPIQVATRMHVQVGGYSEKRRIIEA